MGISKQHSSMFYVVKALSCVLIVWSHMPFGGNMPYEAIRMSVGQIGVFAFFVCAGYFYKEKGNKGNAFWKKKLISIVFPWLLFSTITYVISCLIGGAERTNLLSYFKWVFGIGSHYWYMPVLLVCYGLFSLICTARNRAEDVMLYSCVGISALSVVVSACGMINYNTTFNQYTNICNWLGVFAVGVIICKKNLINEISSPKWMIITLPLLILFVLLSSKRAVMIEAYIDEYSLPIELFGCLCIFAAAKLLCNSNLLIDIGKKSFFIYLVHIQVAGVINTRLPYNEVFFVLRPIVAGIVCYIGAKIVEWILIKMKSDAKIGILFGLR